MLFTSYFAKIKKFPDNFIPVSISQWPPKGYDGLQCRKLAPTKEILITYKENHEKDEAYWNKWYEKKYSQDVLDKIDLKELINEFASANLSSDEILRCDEKIWESKDIHMVFVCFEKSENFCHRNLLSERLRQIGIPCREVTEQDFEKYAPFKEESIER